MAATVILCERNGAVPGNPTINTAGISWRGTDNSNQTYVLLQDALYSNTTSYEKYNYLQFSGAFSSISNVTLTNVNTIDPNFTLRISNTANTSRDCVSYASPVNTVSEVAINNFSTVNSNISLLVGPSGDTDPADPNSKQSLAVNEGVPIYTNYFVTQLTVGINAPAGSLTPVIFTLTYDET